MSYRQLTAEEEKLEETVLEKWDQFLVYMQDANEFVNTQTPLITQNLDESYLVCDAASFHSFVMPSHELLPLIKFLLILVKTITS